MTDQPAVPDSQPSDPSPPASAPGGERELLERLALATLAELRRARRWNLVVRLAWLAFLVTLAVVWMGPQWFDAGSDGPHSALVEVRGIIGDDSDASADRIVAGLQAAFQDADTAGVILRINSPGGSPVHAGLRQRTRSSACASCTRRHRCMRWFPTSPRPEATTSPPPRTRSTRADPASWGRSEC